MGTQSYGAKALCVTRDTAAKPRQFHADDDARIHSNLAQTLAAILRVFPLADPRASTRFSVYCFHGLHDENDEVAVGCGAAACASVVPLVLLLLL